jgi:hypothetical protein
MKILLFLISFSLFGQNKTCHEQIVFDFYKDSILKLEKHDGKVLILKKLKENNYSLWSKNALSELNFKLNDTAASIHNCGINEIKNIDSNTFDILKKWKKNKSFVYVSFATCFYDKNIVTIIDNSKKEKRIYYFLINEFGVITKWFDEYFIKP